LPENLSFGGDQNHLKLGLFGAKVADIAKPNAQFHTTSTLRFSGAERIAVLAYGKTTHLAAQGDWPNPGFDGGVLPVSRSITKDGFTAEWSVPFVARGMRSEGPVESMAGSTRQHWACRSSKWWTRTSQ
jgi:inner membrane protein